MAKLDNIVKLNTKNEAKYPYATILTYLTRKGQDSENTRKTYERHIRDFFRTMRNKELEQLTKEDLIFSPEQIESYQVSLKEKYKGATVNNTITAIRECYNKLKRNGFDVDLSWFDLERYDEHDKEKYDTLTHEEVLAIIDLVSKTRKGNEKALLVRLAYATAFRKDSLLKLQFDQIVNIDGQWFIKTLGKGNKLSHKKLTDDLYNTLMKFKEEVGRDVIFQLEKKTVDKMMKYIREKMNFGDRKIVFHSFKKASLNEVNRLSGGDLKAIQAQGDHADIKTSLNDYIESKKMEDLIAVDTNTHIPVEAVRGISSEEWELLFLTLDRNTQIKILKKMGAM